MRNWFPIGLTVLLVAGIAGLLTVAVRGALHDRDQVRGTVTVTGCTFEAYGRHGDTYLCRGRFSGPFDVPEVMFPNLGELTAGTTVAAAVSGPGDTTADLVSEGYWRLVVTIGGSIALLVILVLVWRTRRHSARSGSLAR
ncbi:hypothetical protein Drose_02120 [Dactylosporangium roseum]|uniref:DUF3592 domain-containing protein n=1 Tax=Dactylosporangium roseum TaxID=47989 RepID=A0ABY5Z6L0_9ACTN|nr:hypothetical protein [Dactylosporangium roseum]UWZ37132.1 hypothetical protein Drose_02120 [Dactylosporangium roseum]